MAIEGVPQNPTGITGSSGLQPTAGSPEPDEAKAAAKPFGASASDASQKDNRVPLERFQEVYNRMKGAEEALARLQQPQQNQAPPWLQPSAPPDPSNQIAELRKLAKKVAGDPDQFADVIEQMTTVKATAATHDALKSFFEDQQKKSDELRFKSESARSFEMAASQWPDLLDENSEFRRRAEQIYLNTNLSKIPEGQYMAALYAWNERSQRGTGTNPRPSSLDVPSAPVRPKVSGDIQDEKRKTMEAMKSGKQEALEQFLGKHMETIVKQPRAR